MPIGPVDTGWPSYPSSATPVGRPAPAPAPDYVGKLADPSPPSNPGARIRLATMADVAKEIRKLYREARAGTLATGEATKLAYLLNMLAGILTASDLEARLAAIETDRAR